MNEAEPWPAVPLNTELSTLVVETTGPLFHSHDAIADALLNRYVPMRHLPTAGSSILVTGQRRALMSVSMQPRRDLGGYLLDPQLHVHGWVMGGWPGWRVFPMPDFATVEAAAVALGTVPTAAALVPGVRTLMLSRPMVVGENGRRMSLTKAFQRMPSPPAGPPGAAAQVDEVRATYGRMLGDVAYRIENAALFDSAVSTTREFEAAMSLWQDLSPEAPERERRRVAGLVKVTFDTARAHAETVGVNHLPQQARAEAQRAAKAARLASAASTEAERAAAMSQAVRILQSLALYYLPDPDDIGRELETGR